MRIYRPDGDVDTTLTRLADPVARLAGCRIAVLDNGKPNAVVVMTRVAEALAARTGARLSLVVKKGPGGRSANAAVPCAPDVFARVRAEADVVITGAADCGSCTAYSVHDTVELERSGIPTVLLTTTKFRPVVAALAAATGLPDIRTLVVDHPIGGVDRETLHRRADCASDALAAQFTTVAPTVPAPPPSVAVPAHAERALAELRTLVASDGADFETISFDAATGSLHLRLLIPDAHCAECVMPRAALESIATTRFATHGLRTIVIDDPRDATP
jgi:hypothetical protein